MSIKKEKEKIDGILIRCNSYERFPKFLTMSKELKGELYWYTLRKCYFSSDNLYQYRKEIKESFSCDEPDRNKLMSKRELNYLQSLPEEITIYRGMTIKEFESGEFGVSWTLKREKGEFFMKTYGRNFDTNHISKMVHELTINKDDIISYYGERKEFEVIYIHKK
jgi:hypothetical protein